MRKAVWAVCIGAGTGACLWAASWPSVAGNPQRDGWAQGETTLTRKAVTENKVQLLYKRTFKNTAIGLNALSTPIDLAQLIGYTGFKELLFVGGSSNTAFAIDSDLNTPYFEQKFEPLDKSPAGKSTLACPGGMTSSLVIAGNSGVARFGGGGGLRTGFTWALTGDGYMRTMRQQDGQALMIPPTKILPPNSNTTALNTFNNAFYVSTINGCAGPNALYAAQFTMPTMPGMPGLPMVSPSKWEVTSFPTNGSGFSGSGGTAISNRGDVVFGQVAEGRGDVAGTYSDTVLALDAKTLTVKDYFTPSGTMPALTKGVESAGVTPVVFAMDGKDMLVAGGRDGRLYLLDSTSLGGSDHHTPVFRTEPIVTPDSKFAGNGIWGTFATWTDAANGNTRWLYASVRGAASVKFGMENGTAPTGAIVAFKVEKVGGKPALTPQWISRDMKAPAAPITAAGLVYALSSGLPSRTAKGNGAPYTAAEVEKMSGKAVLYILDGATGKELYSSGAASSFSNSGLALATGRVYFATHDNTVYAYGVPQER